MTQDAKDEIVLAACRVDLLRGGVYRGEERAQLSSRELALLRHFAARPGRVVTRDELLTHVWGYCDAVVSRACDNSVHRLRTKIEADPTRPIHLLTVFGEGYRFEHASPSAVPPVLQPERRDADFTLGESLIDLAGLRVITRGEEIALTHQEALLLRRLHAANGALVARSTLMREIWGQSTTSRAVDNAISRLRVKIEIDPAAPRYLLTERGSGYRLVAPKRELTAVSRGGLVGRKREMDELGRALAAARWVLVTGPGGIGKTRLVRQIATEHQDHVWWVDLAQADSAGDVLLAVGRLLCIELSGDLSDRIGRVLARKGRGLLVLDNLEQLSDEIAPLVAAWLNAAPALVIVGTSRIRLGLDGEISIELAPLEQQDAAALFSARLSPASSLYTELPSLVQTLVSRLDGLPLALELAAAGAGTLGLAGLLERLDRRLDLLVHPRAVNERHRSLRTVLQDSWELLEAGEVEALLLCSRFREGFSVDDVEDLFGDQAIDSLQALRDHSLVHNRSDGRFGIYETIRLFADEQRASLPDRGEALDRRWIERMAQLGDPSLLRTLWLTGREDLARRQRAAASELEHAAQVAIRWGNGEAAARVLLGAASVRTRYGPYRALLAQIEHVLAEVPLEDPTKAKLLTAQGDLCSLLDRPEAAVQAAERALEIAPEDALETRAAAYAVLGTLLPTVKQRSPPEESLDRASELYLRLGRPDLSAWCRARAMNRRHNLEALPALEQTISCARQQGDILLAAKATVWLARFDDGHGRPGLARRRYREAFDALRQAELFIGVVGVGARLLYLGALTGEREQLDALLEQLLELLERAGSPIDEVMCWMYTSYSHTLAGEFTRSQDAICRARHAQVHCAPSPLIEGIVDLYEADLMLALQDPASAGALAFTACGRFADDPESSVVPLAQSLLARSYALLGRPAEALALANRAVQTTTGSLDVGASLCLLRRGIVRISAGDRAGARADLDLGVQLAAHAGLVRRDSAPGVEAAHLRALLEAPEDTRARSQA